MIRTDCEKKLADQVRSLRTHFQHSVLAREKEFKRELEAIRHIYKAKFRNSMSAMETYYKKQLENFLLSTCANANDLHLAQVLNCTVNEFINIFSSSSAVIMPSTTSKSSASASGRRLDDNVIVSQGERSARQKAAELLERVEELQSELSRTRAEMRVLRAKVNHHTIGGSSKKNTATNGSGQVSPDPTVVVSNHGAGSLPGSANSLPINPPNVAASSSSLNPPAPASPPAHKPFAKAASIEHNAMLKLLAQNASFGSRSSLENLPASGTAGGAVVVNNSLNVPASASTPNSGGGGSSTPNGQLISSSEDYQKLLLELHLKDEEIKRLRGSGKAQGPLAANLKASGVNNSHLHLLLRNPSYQKELMSAAAATREQQIHRQGSESLNSRTTQPNSTVSNQENNSCCNNPNSPNPILLNSLQAGFQQQQQQQSSTVGSILASSVLAGANEFSESLAKNMTVSLHEVRNELGSKGNNRLPPISESGVDNNKITTITLNNNNNTESSPGPGALVAQSKRKSFSQSNNPNNNVNNNASLLKRRGTLSMNAGTGHLEGNAIPEGFITEKQFSIQMYRYTQKIEELRELCQKYDEKLRESRDIKGQLREIITEREQQILSLEEKIHAIRYEYEGRLVSLKENSYRLNKALQIAMQKEMDMYRKRYEIIRKSLRKFESHGDSNGQAATELELIITRQSELLRLLNFNGIMDAANAANANQKNKDGGNETEETSDEDESESSVSTSRSGGSSQEQLSDRGGGVALEGSQTLSGMNTREFDFSSDQFEKGSTKSANSASSNGKKKAPRE